METNKHNYNRYEYNGHYGEPPDHRIPSRQSSHSLQDGNFWGSQQNIPQMGGHESIQMQHMGQQPQYLGPAQYRMPPDQGHYLPDRQKVYSVQYGQNGIQQPAGQNMVRDTTTPMPSDNEYDGTVIQPPIALTIFKRIVSTLFIILDISLNWIQFASWNGNIDIPDWLNFLEVANSLHAKSPLKAQCDKGSGTLTTVYGLFAGIGTAYGLVRIVNTIGETIIEYQKKYPSENKPRFRGFQFLHGWVETVLAWICDDIPQALLLFLFNWYCTIDFTAMGKVIVWMVFKDAKNIVRLGTCKHIYKPCKSGGCCSDCCVYECDCVCCCTILYFRPCACGGEKQCCEAKSYNICPELKCVRDDQYCGEINKDPEWAENLNGKLFAVFSLLVAALTVVTVVKNIQFSFLSGVW